MPQPGREQASGNRREGGRPLQPPRRRSVATAVLLLIAALLFIDGVAGERGWLANRRAAAQCEAARQALKDEQARNAALREQARRLEALDPNAIEEEARRQLLLMKPGEKVFIVRDHPAK